MLRTLLMSLGLIVGVAGPAAAADKVDLKVSIIFASKKPGPVDPALARIRGTLEKSFGGFQSFKELAKHKIELPLKKTRQIKLPNDQTAGFTYEGQAKDQEKIRIAIPKSKVDVGLRVQRRKVFYQAGLRYNDGILILALYLR
ncbi:MAG: hypothetical protein KC549_16235 [Myxococcales bacterium]|nr:hypothetical protein [Myxococcales bacterium]MCB9546309.1 hypothetical protein [Myxococcales bacterium]